MNTESTPPHERVYGEAKSYLDIPEPEITLLTDTDASVASVIFSTPYGEFRGLGSSKKHPDDLHDPEIAALLSLSRALYEVARLMEDRAGRLVNVASLQRTVSKLRQQYYEGIVDFPAQASGRWDVLQRNQPVHDLYRDREEGVMSGE